MSPGVDRGLTAMTYAPVNGLQLYYEAHGTGRPLVLLHGGLMTIDLNWGPLLEPLAATRQVIAVELQGHGRTADTDRPMTIEALADDVVALLDHLGIADADLFGFSLGGLVAYTIALGAPDRVGKLIVASADAHRPPGRESVPLDDDRMPTQGGLPGDARRLRRGRSRPGALRRVRGQDVDDGARVPGVDRRDAIAASRRPC